MKVEKLESINVAATLRYFVVDYTAYLKNENAITVISNSIKFGELQTFPSIKLIRQQLEGYYNPEGTFSLQLSDVHIKELLESDFKTLLAEETAEVEGNRFFIVQFYTNIAEQGLEAYILAVENDGAYLCEAEVAKVLKSTYGLSEDTLLYNIRIQEISAQDFIDFKAT
jgi:hypothetical protein